MRLARLRKVVVVAEVRRDTLVGAHDPQVLVLVDTTAAESLAL